MRDLQDVNGNPGDTASVIDGAICNASVTSGCDNKPLTVTVGSLPFGVAVDKRTDTIYVVNANENTLSVINGKTCNATNTSGCSQTPSRCRRPARPATSPRPSQ